MSDNYIELNSTAVAFVSDFVLKEQDFNYSGINYVQISCIEKNEDRMTINITALDGHAAMIAQELDCLYHGDIEFPLLLKVTSDIHKFLKAPKKSALSTYARFYVNEENIIDTITMNDNARMMRIPKEDYPKTHDFPDISKLMNKIDTVFGNRDKEGRVILPDNNYFAVPFNKYAIFDASKYFGKMCNPLFYPSKHEIVVCYPNYLESYCLSFLGITTQINFGDEEENIRSMEYKLPVHKFANRCL